MNIRGLFRRRLVIRLKHAIDKTVEIDKLAPTRVPDFFCIGTEKAGTTWLWTMMKDHPDVGVPAIKELRFFIQKQPKHYFKNICTIKRLLDDSSTVSKIPDFPKHLTIETRLLHGGQRSYLAIFGRMKQRIVGEVSPQYCVMHQSGINRMKTLAPQARIILLLRDPVDRAISGGKMRLRALGLEPNDKLLFREAKRHLQLRFSRCAGVIDKFSEAFDGRVFVGFFDDIADRPMGLLAEVCEFLGVDHAPEFYPNIAKRINLGLDYEASASIREKLYAALQDEYDALAVHYPERVARWRAKYQ
jgi:hypothetical protein